MPARLSRADLKRLGVDVPKSSSRGSRGAPGPYHTRCVECDEHFHTIVSEDRHVIDPGHRRFETILPERQS
jgi:hypothetical protein